jgi:hypothetical protein
LTWKTKKQSLGFLLIKFTCGGDEIDCEVLGFVETITGGGGITSTVDDVCLVIAETSCRLAARVT